MYKGIATMAVLVCMLGSLCQGETIGYWRFNEQDPGQQTTGTAGEIIDSSGNGHHGYGYGTILPSYGTGEAGTSAIALTANNDCLVIPNNSNFNLMLGDLQDYTIEAVINASADNIVPLESHALLTKRAYTGSGYSFRLTTDGRLGLYIEGSGYNFLCPDAMGTSVVADGAWHHVAVVIDANANSALTSATFYVDGIADGTTKLTDTVYNPSGYPWFNENIVNTTDLLVGDFASRTEDQFIGKIDQLRFSTGALETSQFLGVDVPEPSSLALAVAGAMGLLAYAWRKRK